MALFTYDLGKLTLTKKDKTELEAEFDGPGEYLVCSNEMADQHIKGEILRLSYVTRSGKTVAIFTVATEIFRRIV